MQRSLRSTASAVRAGLGTRAHHATVGRRSAASSAGQLLRLSSHSRWLWSLPALLALGAVSTLLRPPLLAEEAPPRPKGKGKDRLIRVDEIRRHGADAARIWVWRGNGVCALCGPRVVWPRLTAPSRRHHRLDRHTPRRRRHSQSCRRRHRLILVHLQDTPSATLA